MMICMRLAKVMLDAFWIRRKWVFRCQWQRGVEHCVAHKSANEQGQAAMR